MSFILMFISNFLGGKGDISFSISAIKYILIGSLKFELILHSVEAFNPYSKLDPEDYYKHPDGYLIFTEKYHLKRGYCCKNGCKHCPYGFNDKKKKNDFREGDTTRNT